MQISSIIRQIQQTPTFQYQPAELDIKIRPVEMDADWESVWEELGVLPPESLARDLKEEATRKGLEAIQQCAVDGDRIGNIAKSKTTFGQLAFERYIRRGVKDVQIEALPKFGVNIDVRVYPIEIDVETKGVVRV